MEFEWEAAFIAEKMSFFERIYINKVKNKNC